MFLFKILIALTLLGSINAAVPNIRTSLERRATQSCHTTNHGIFISYSVLIGVPYAGKTDCDDTYNALTHAGPMISEQGYQWDGVPISNWQCVEQNGNIQLWFNAAANEGNDINAALESRYPSVSSFNCPGS